MVGGEAVPVYDQVAPELELNPEVIDQQEQIDGLREQLNELSSNVIDIRDKLDERNNMAQTMQQFFEQNAKVIQLFQQILANQNLQPQAHANPGGNRQQRRQGRQRQGGQGRQPQGQGGGGGPGQNPPGGGGQTPPGGGQGQNPNTQNAPPTPLELAQRHMDTAKADLDASRDHLAELTINRKARTRLTERLFRHARQDVADYEQAQVLFDQMLDRYLTLKQEFLVEEYNANGQNSDRKEMMQKLTREGYAQLRSLSQREVAINDQRLDQLGFTGKALRKWANLSTGKKIIIGVTVGAGTAVTSGALGLGLFGLAAGSAARASLGLFNKASLRNVSAKRQKELERRITRLETNDIIRIRGLRLPTDKALKDNRGEIIENISRFSDGERQNSQRRQAIGAMAVGLSVASLGWGAGAEAGVVPDASWGHLVGLKIPRVHIPGVNWNTGGWHIGGGHPHRPSIDHHPLHHGGSSGSGGSQTGMSHGGGPDPYAGETPKTTPSVSGNGQMLEHLTPNFHSDSFTGVSGEDAVRHALLGDNSHHGLSVFERNGIQVDPNSVTPEKIAAINSDLIREHMHIVSGVGEHGGNVLDWPGGATQNADASAAQGFEKVNGSSVINWDRFMQIARQHGVEFRKAA